MKHIRLSPFTWQLIIFLFLVALLWPGRPDGLVEARFEHYPEVFHSARWYAMEGDYLDIEAVKANSKSEITERFTIEGAYVVTAAQIVRPSWSVKAQRHIPLLSKVLPQRLSRSLGYDIRVRIKPGDWDRLEMAKRHGFELGITIAHARPE